MSEHASTQTSPRGESPSAAEFTSSPLRNRLRVELDAPVAEVWELMGDLSRYPEYSEGLERVEAVVDDEGRCVEYTCYFKPFEEGADGAVSRDVMKWYEPNRGYQPVPLRASDRKRRGGRPPRPRAPAARPAPAPRGQGVDRAGCEAARHRRRDRRPLPLRPLRCSGCAVGRPAQARFPDLLGAGAVASND